MDRGGLGRVTAKAVGSAAWRLISDAIVNGLGLPHKRKKIRARFSDVPSRCESCPILLLVPSSGQSGNVEAQKAGTAGETARIGGVDRHAERLIGLFVIRSRQPIGAGSQSCPILWRIARCELFYCWLAW